MTYSENSKFYREKFLIPSCFKVTLKLALPSVIDYLNS